MDKQYIKMLQQFWYILIVFIRMRAAEARSRSQQAFCCSYYRDTAIYPRIQTIVFTIATVLRY